MTTPEVIGQDYNCETGEVTPIYADEAYYARLAELEAEEADRVTAEAEKAAARTALLERLGITEEEAQLLLK